MLGCARARVCVCMYVIQHFAWFRREVYSIVLVSMF